MANAEPFDAGRLVDAHPSSHGGGANWPLATRAALEAAYFASLSPDEGRYPEFCVALDDSGFESSDARRFECPVALTPASLAKYSQVLDRRAHALVVTQQSEQCSAVIRGIDSVHARRMERARVPEMTGARAGIVVHGPGVVALHDENLAVSLYDRDSYHTPETWKDVAVPAEVSARVVQLVRPDSKEMPWSLKPESMWAVDAVRWQLSRERWLALATPIAEAGARAWLAQLASAIARNRHGGGILVLTTGIIPSSLMSERGTEFERPQASPARAPSSIGGLLEYVFSLTNLEAAWAGFSVLPTRPEGEVELLHWGIRSGVSAALAASRRLSDWAKATASLAAVDGAIVLDHNLSPWLFGAKFSATTVPDSVEFDADAISRRGTRHRSMAAAVGVTPSSIGIVVSQDRSVTVFSNPTGVRLRIQNIWM